MTIHYASDIYPGRSACGITDYLVNVTSAWAKVNCKACKQTPEYTWHLNKVEGFK